jgi:hypothetical protein
VVDKARQDADKEKGSHAKTCPQRFAQTGARHKTTAFSVAMQAGAKTQGRKDAKERRKDSSPSPASQAFLAYLSLICH